MSSITITELNGDKRTLSLDLPGTSNWAQLREQFCQNIAHGLPPLEAYLDAYYKGSDAAPPAKLAMANAQALLCDTHVILRIHKIKTLVVRKTTKKWEYDQQKALEQAEEAYAIAHAQGNAPAMLKAIELQAKLVKILNETVDHKHTFGVLDEATTAVLLEMKKNIESRRKAAAKVIEVTPQVQATVEQ